jgi:hypothetical protein
VVKAKTTVTKMISEKLEQRGHFTAINSLPRSARALLTLDNAVENGLYSTPQAERFFAALAVACK